MEEMTIRGKELDRIGDGRRIGVKTLAKDFRESLAAVHSSKNFERGLAKF